MQSIFSRLGSRWVLTGFGLASAGAMVWMFGPFTSVLEGWLPRVLAIFVMSFVWVGANAAISHVRQRADARLTEGLTRSPAATAAASAAASAAAGAEQVSELRERLNRALTLLRKARGTRGYLYEQPWYMIIGPPGAGKTTALANAGLRFPLAAELGAAELRGVGGTRYCDWSFTDEAVLIDTAGRYTTQDSDAAADKAGWEGFLDLLRRTRSRQPLNGVIIAISATDLALAPAAERLAHARAVRGRIKELYAKLGARIPVYAIFTKLDLILGFTDFFDDLDRDRRGQVWGMTFPIESDRNGPAANFSAEFRALTARLSDRLIDRLQQERSAERRVTIADFPTQFASLELPLAGFIDEAFGGTLLDPAPFLRGIYFASGTQEGSPIDRLTGTLARNFGIDQRQVEMLRPQQGRGYFLETLLKQVVFGEAMLVVRNPRAARRRLLLRGTAWGVAGLISIGGVAALWLTAGNAAMQQQQFDSKLTDYLRAVAAAKLDPVPLGATDLPSIAPLLDRARALQPGANAGGGIAGLGMTDHDQIAAAGGAVYRRALERILLPRLIALLEARMRAQVNDIDALYSTTRVYLILGGFGPMDRAMVRSWMQANWQKNYAGESLAGLRADLLRHLDALLAQPFGELVQLDGALIAQSQALIGRVSIPARAYALIRASAEAQALRPFVPADAMGGFAGHYFIRQSGKPLTDPVAGFFTVAGYQTVVLPALAKASDQVMRDSWVMGQATQFDPTNVAARQQLEHGIVALYARDYQAQWDGLLEDLDVVPPADPATAITDFQMLTSARGPIKLLLSAVVQQFAMGLAPPPAASGPATATVKPPPVAAPPDSQILALEAHFHNLHDFVESGQIDTMLGSLNQLQQQIAAQVTANPINGPVPITSDAAQTLQQMSASAPQPIGRWLATLARRGGAVRDDAARRQAAAAFAGPGGAAPLCQQVVQRFPFRAAARDDVSIDDFAQLFAPNGKIDAFFNQYLRGYVDSTGKDWKLRDGVESQAPVTKDSLAQFQRALTIRDTFFGQGGQQPQIRFALQPSMLDSDAQQVTLNFGGRIVSWSRGVAQNVYDFDWPGATRMTTVRVSFDPPGDGPELVQFGPWALFRLLSKASLRPAGDSSYAVTLTQGAREARMELSVGTAHSPFDATLFSGFKCPVVRP